MCGRATFLPRLMLGFIALFFIASINYWAVDLPNSDDYSAILLPLLKIRSATTLSDVVSALFEPHTQHFQVVLRVVSWATTLDDGYYHTTALIFLGSLFVVPLLLLLSKCAGLKSDWLFVLLALLLCQPLYAEATQWATNAIPYLWVNVFALAAFVYCLQSSAGHFAWGVFFCCAAVLTWGNGVLVPLEVCVALLVIRSRRAFVVIPIAFLGVALIFSNPNSPALQPGIPYLVDATVYALRVLGCSLGYYSGTASMAWGAAALALWAALAVRVARLKGAKGLVSSLTLFEVFLLGSVFLCGLTRLSEGAVTAFTTSRYTLPSILFFSCLGIRIFEYTEHGSRLRIIRPVVAVLCTLWFGFSHIYYYPLYIVRHDLHRDSRARWACFGDGLAGMGWKENAAIHRQAESENLLQKISLAECEARLAPPILIPQPQGSAENAIVEVEYCLSSPARLHLSGYAFRPQENNWKGSYALIMKSENARYVAPMTTRLRPEVRDHMRLRNYASSNVFGLLYSGFSVFVDTSGLPSGTYALFLQISNHGQVSWKQLPDALLVD